MVAAQKNQNKLNLRSNGKFSLSSGVTKSQNGKTEPSNILNHAALRDYCSVTRVTVRWLVDLPGARGGALQALTQTPACQISADHAEIFLSPRIVEASFLL